MIRDLNRTFLEILIYRIKNKEMSRNTLVIKPK